MDQGFCNPIQGNGGMVEDKMYWNQLGCKDVWIPELTDRFVQVHKD